MVVRRYMAILKIWFNDLSEEAQKNLREQIEEDLLSDKELDWEEEYEEVFWRCKYSDIPDKDDYIDKKRDKYLENQDEEVDDYINKNDDGIEFII
jgi:hypothetical protein